MAEYILAKDKLWKLIYQDLSTFTSADGLWQDAPQSYVRSLETVNNTKVMYHRDGSKTASDDVVRIPFAAFYIWVSEMDLPVHTWDYMSHLRLSGKVKFGQWVVRSHFNRIASLAKTVLPSYPDWTIYYANCSMVSSEDCTWDKAPLDGVIGIVNSEGAFICSHDYYYWKDGKITNTDSQEKMLQAAPEIKIGMTSYVNWPPVVNPAYATR